MFYWGRRGPSVHLTYTVPQDVDLEYAYSEIVVEEGDDPVGSYFMANGFREGYFGIQVNSSQERRVLFSVWSPLQDRQSTRYSRGSTCRIVGEGSRSQNGRVWERRIWWTEFLGLPLESGANVSIPDTGEAGW